MATETRSYKCTYWENDTVQEIEYESKGRRNSKLNVFDAKYAILRKKGVRAFKLFDSSDIIHVELLKD